MAVRTPEDVELRKPKRAPWRQRLIDAETGLRIGLRTDSTLFFHLFCVTAILAASLVMDLSVTEWGLVILSCGLALSAELFHQLLRQLTLHLQHHLSPSVEQITRIGTAATVTANVTAIIVIGLVFWGHLRWIVAGD